ncbi:hypothetical protein D3C87_1442180 [compost metagenome]
MEDGQHTAARSPTAFLDDAEVDPPSWQRFGLIAGFRQGLEHVLDDLLAHAVRPCCIHNGNVDRHDIGRRRLIRQELATDGHAVYGELAEVNLETDTCRSGRLPYLRHQHGVGQCLCEFAALRRCQAGRGRGDCDDGHGFVGVDWSAACYFGCDDRSSQLGDVRLPQIDATTGNAAARCRREPALLERSTARVASQRHRGARNRRRLPGCAGPGAAGTAARCVKSQGPGHRTAPAPAHRTVGARHRCGLAGYRPHHGRCHDHRLRRAAHILAPTLQRLRSNATIRAIASSARSTAVATWSPHWP